MYFMDHRINTVVSQIVWCTSRPGGRKGGREGREGVGGREGRKEGKGGKEGGKREREERKGGGREARETLGLPSAVLMVWPVCGGRCFLLSLEVRLDPSLEGEMIGSCEMLVTI